MSIYKPIGTPIKVHTDESVMISEATGDLTRTYTVVTGVYRRSTEPNEIYYIDLYTDAGGNLHGIFRIK